MSIPFITCKGTKDLKKLSKSRKFTKRLATSFDIFGSLGAWSLASPPWWGAASTSEVAAKSRALLTSSTKRPRASNHTHIRNAMSKVVAPEPFGFQKM